jgi:hypothetical protein
MPLPYLDQAQTVSIVSVRVTMPASSLGTLNFSAQCHRRRYGGRAIATYSVPSSRSASVR